MNMLAVYVLAATLLCMQVEGGKKPVYKPEFDYQLDVLQRLTDLETENARIVKTADSLAEEIQAAYKTIGALNSTVHETVQNIGSGSTYIRWGRTTCGRDAEIVYTGYAAGAYYTHGGASNYLCLTNKPNWGEHFDTKSAHGRLYGVEYEFGEEHESEAPCVVCKITRPVVLMTPGTNECLEGWKLEYSGLLVSGHHGHKRSQYVCLDGDYESVGSTSNSNGALFYDVQGICGSLACPPYINGHQLPCSVCSFSGEKVEAMEGKATYD